MFGFPTQDDVNDEKLLGDLVRTKLDLFTPITSVSRLGKGSCDKSPPLLAGLRDESNTRKLLFNAKKLLEFKTPAAKDHVYINANLLLKKHPHPTALGKLKICKAAGEKDIGICGGEIVHITKKP